MSSYLRASDNDDGDNDEQNCQCSETEFISSSGDDSDVVFLGSTASSSAVRLSLLSQKQISDITNQIVQKDFIPPAVVADQRDTNLSLSPDNLDTNSMKLQKMAEDSLRNSSASTYLSPNWFNDEIEEILELAIPGDDGDYNRNDTDTNLATKQQISATTVSTVTPKQMPKFSKSSKTSTSYHSDTARSFRESHEDLAEIQKQLRKSLGISSPSTSSSSSSSKFFSFPRGPSKRIKLKRRNNFDIYYY